MPVNFFKTGRALKFNGSKLVFPDSYFSSTGEYYRLDVGEAAIYDIYSSAGNQATIDTYIKLDVFREGLYEILIFDLIGDLSNNEAVLYVDNDETNYEFTFVNKVVSYDSITTSTQIFMSTSSGIKLLVFPNFITRCLLYFSFTGIRLYGSCEQSLVTGNFYFYDFVNFFDGDFSTSSGKFGSFRFGFNGEVYFRVIIHRLF